METLGLRAYVGCQVLLVLMGNQEKGADQGQMEVEGLLERQEQRVTGALMDYLVFQGTKDIEETEENQDPMVHLESLVIRVRMDLLDQEGNRENLG